LERAGGFSTGPFSHVQQGYDSVTGNKRESGDSLAIAGFSVSFQAFERTPAGSKSVKPVYFNFFK
jgi:hypothetical protein